ncbi:uncharacterized protein B4U80_12146 [Leptotrombidium deliense]|uniref:DUF659 domain-containing protein n=1 Tax=Leptotrombidium deliense TaxID=299467 RepID=A0A443RXR6_9ACAR|nr:uncharacterized protein B4U80_12146 [Leptotrombidium deliense]
MQLKQLLAKFIFSSSSPFSAIENEYLKQFLQKIGSGFRLPSRRELSHSLLNNVFKEAKEYLRSKIVECDFFSILIDGWENVRHVSVINIILCFPLPMFYKSIEFGGQMMTGQLLYSEIKEVIEELGEDKVVAVVSDNGTNMVAAVKSITQISKNCWNTMFRTCSEFTN